MIAATFERKCLSKGGIYLVYKSLEHFGIDLLIQDHGKVDIDKKYNLVIGFGQPSCLPPNGNYKRAMVYCSPLLQSELSGEIQYLAYYASLIERGELDYLLITDKDLAKSLERSDGRILWLPICDFREITESENKRDGYIITGATRPNKNFFNQMLALSLCKTVNKVSLLGEDKTILISIFESFISNKNEAKKFSIIPHKTTYQEVLDVVSEHKALMQVSLSESFCYAVWEASMLGVPSLCTTSTYWYRGDKIGEYCLVSDFDSSIKILEAVTKIENMNEEEYSLLSKEVRQVAEKTMEFHIKETKKLFESII